MAIDESNEQFDSIKLLYDAASQYQDQLNDLIAAGASLSDPRVKALGEMITDYTHRASYLSLGIFD